MYQYKATIDRVIDGDTVDVLISLGFHLYSRVRLRLLGIDTPELRGPEKEHGMYYRDFVEGWFQKFPDVIIESKKTGKYGRWLARVWTPDHAVCLNEILEELLRSNDTIPGIDG